MEFFCTCIFVFPFIDKFCITFLIFNNSYMYDSNVFDISKGNKLSSFKVTSGNFPLSMIV